MAAPTLLEEFDDGAGMSLSTSNGQRARITAGLGRRVPRRRTWIRRSPPA